MTQILAKDVHESLESGRRVRQTKRHDQKLVVALMCSECHHFNAIVSMLLFMRTW